MGQVLYLVDHDIVYLWAFIASVPDDVEHVVNRIHDIVASAADLPPLVLAEGLVDVHFFLSGQEGIGGDVDIGSLGEVLPGVLMGLC